MLGLFRRHLNSWVARAFFMLLVATFVLWGVGDVIRNIFTDDTSGAVATVSGQKVETADVQALYTRQLAQLTRMLGTKTDPTPAMRQGVAAQALQQLITEAALNATVARYGLAVPDDAVRRAVYDMPEFRGSEGKFDRGQLETVLRNNNLTEAKFLQLIRAQLGQAQLIDSVRAGVVSPDILTREIYAYQKEKRAAEAVSLPFAAAPAPKPPTEAELTRWYENHKDLYSTPEYRRIKAVVLAPQTVAKEIQVSDDDIKAAYEQNRAEYSVPEKRSVEVLLTKDKASADKLAATWSAGADWATMKKQPGATAVELNEATEAEFPAPELGKAVFAAAAAGTVAPPVHSALGWHVFKVTKIDPGSAKTLAQATPTLRAEVLADKAADLIDDRASKIEDMLAGGTTLDDLPGNLGLGAVTGTLDAQGMTPDGKPAPIPGSDALRSALIAAAFQMKQGDPVQLVEAPRAPDGSDAYYAVNVEQVIPPSVKKQADVADEVKADWTRDAVRHEQNVAATAILVAVKGGQTLAEAAPGLNPEQLPPTDRTGDTAGVPAQLVEPLFGLKKGEPTMVETADGFVVAVLTKIDDPAPSADPIGFGQVRDALAKALGDDVQSVLSTTLRERGDPKINRAALEQISQSQ